MCLSVSIFFSVLCVNAKSFCLSRMNVFVFESIVGLERKQLKPCWWQTAGLIVIGGYIVVCQLSEESDDGSLLGTLCSLRPVMALFPGCGFPLTANHQWQHWPCSPLSSGYSSTDQSRARESSLLFLHLRNADSGGGGCNGWHPSCVQIVSCFDV